MIEKETVADINMKYPETGFVSFISRLFKLLHYFIRPAKIMSNQSVQSLIERSIELSEHRFQFFGHVGMGSAFGFSQTSCLFETIKVLGLIEHKLLPLSLQIWQAKELLHLGYFLPRMFDHVVTIQDLKIKAKIN